MVDIYLVAINNVDSPWINNPSNIAERINELASARGHTCHFIRTLTELGDLVEKPPEDVVFINTHGEVLPLPEERKGNRIHFFQKIGTLDKAKD